MDIQLKKVLEDLVEEFVKFSKSDFNFKPKRLVLCTKEKVRNEGLLFNYLENRFLTTQIFLDKPILISKISDYRESRDKQEGDYTLIISDYLKRFHFKESQFLA